MSVIPMISCTNEQDFRSAVDEIVRRAPDEEIIDIIIAGYGTCWDESVQLHTWMRSYEHRSRLRAVAVGDLWMSNLIMFLAFDRRTAHPVTWTDARLGPDAATPEDSDPTKNLRQTYHQIIVDRTHMTHDEVRSHDSDGTVIHGTELWRLGFCNEVYDDSGTESAPNPDDNGLQLTPLLFISEVSGPTVNSLMQQIEQKLLADSSATLTVVMASTGGELSPALGFYYWLRKYTQRNRLRVVASAPVVSAASVLFLAFDKREVDEFGSVIFHEVILKAPSADPRTKALNVLRTELLLNFYAQHLDFPQQLLSVAMSTSSAMDSATLREAGFLSS